MKNVVICITVGVLLIVLILIIFQDESARWQNKGERYYKKGQYGKALECFEKSISIRPDNPYAYFGRGVVYYKLARFEDAISDYSKSIELKPDFDGAYYYRGKSYGKLDELEKAISDYNECIKLEPEKKEYYYTRGLLYYNNRKIYDLDLAKKDLYRACELGHDDACYILSDFWPE